MWRELLERISRAVVGYELQLRELWHTGVLRSRLRRHLLRVWRLLPERLPCVLVRNELQLRELQHAGVLRRRRRQQLLRLRLDVPERLSRAVIRNELQLRELQHTGLLREELKRASRLTRCGAKRKKRAHHEFQSGPFPLRRLPVSGLESALPRVRGRPNRAAFSHFTARKWLIFENTGRSSNRKTSASQVEDPGANPGRLHQHLASRCAAARFGARVRSSVPCSVRVFREGLTWESGVRIPSRAPQFSACSVVVTHQALDLTSRS